MGRTKRKSRSINSLKRTRKIKCDAHFLSMYKDTEILNMEKYVVEDKAPVHRNREEKREYWRQKPLYVDKALAPHPFTKPEPIGVPKNMEKERKKQLTRIFRNMGALRHHEKKKAAAKLQHYQATFDVWEHNPKDDVTQFAEANNLDKEWFTEVQSTVKDKMRIKPRRSVPPNKIPALPIPDAGLSYHPDKLAHQQYLDPVSYTHLTLPTKRIV
eukprot:TRINITY_DN2451_c0_g1_i2.p1 TRINITY_DN2451_c0_g1~~TRINITY_DN2451_c0_g1_i2.p1  ORF type:complete len:214 (-),score=44.84 TRINITY_DN2451_c0_g1_i2:2-643(-)